MVVVIGNLHWCRNKQKVKSKLQTLHQKNSKIKKYCNE